MVTPAPWSALVAFLLLTFAATWTCFGAVASGAFPVSTPAGRMLVFAGTIMPSLVAIALTARAAGATGVRALLARITPSGVAMRWYVFALTYMVAIKLSVAVLHRALTGAWPRFGHEPWLLVPFVIALSTPVQAGEEIGWRGYALPRLAARLGLRTAGVVIGVIWALWHLPLFFVAGADTHGQSFAYYAMQVTALSVAFTWLYAHTHGSLLPVMLMHAAVNNTKDIVPAANPGAANVFGLDASLVAWLGAALMWACAAYFLVRMPRPAPGVHEGDTRAEPPA